MQEKQEMNIKKLSSAKIIVIALLIISVIVFGSLSWFTMSKEVEGSGTQMTASDLPFEISVESPYIKGVDYSSILNSHFGYNTTSHETGGSVEAIKCLMNDVTLDTENPMRGLQPGSYGTLTFHVKPKVTGTYEINFNVATTGYHAEFDLDNNQAIKPSSIKTTEVNGEDVPIFYSLTDYATQQSENITALNETITELTAKGTLTDAEKKTLDDARKELSNATEDSVNCPKAARYLNGHILFFENWDSTTKYYSKFIPDTGFERTYTFTANDVAGTMSDSRKEELTVTIYWIWPNTFGQIVLDNGNKNLSTKDPAMFSSTTTAVNGKTPRQELTDYISSHGSYFFESTNTNLNESNLANTINTLSTTPDNIIPLSNGYNNADQIIGENVQVLLAEITVITD